MPEPLHKKVSLQNELILFTTTTSAIVDWAMEATGANVPPDQIEVITETVKRGRGLIERGFKLGFNIPVQFGGGGFEFEI